MGHSETKSERKKRKKREKEKLEQLRKEKEEARLKVQEETVKSLQSDRKKIEALAYLEQGNKEFDASRFTRAVNMYTLALSLDPTQRSAFYNRGNAYRNLGQIADAIRDFNAMIALNGQDGEAWTKKGVCYLVYSLDPHPGVDPRACLVKAIKCLDRALLAQPGNGEAFLKRGQCYARLDKFEHAVADFSACIALKVKVHHLGEAFWRRGTIFARQGKLRSSIHDMDNALRIDPKRYSH